MYVVHTNWGCGVLVNLHLDLGHDVLSNDGSLVGDVVDGVNLEQSIHLV